MSGDIRIESPAGTACVLPHILDFIRTNLPLAPVPSVPEILLHRAGPKSGLWRLAEMDEIFGAPYWAYDWGGGLALARHILDHPEAVAGRRVLDLGAGSGFVAIAAAKAGAKSVIAADIDRYAMAAIGLNAAANGVALSTFFGDLTAEPPPDVDVVLVGDLFYEEELARRVTLFLDTCLQSKIDVLIGDPWRAFLPIDHAAFGRNRPNADNVIDSDNLEHAFREKPVSTFSQHALTRLELLAEYPGPDFGSADRSGARHNAVFSFRP